MNTYSTSSGQRYKKSAIDRRVRTAKEMKLQSQLDEHGYNFCEVTGRSRGEHLDCSHIISVDECQKSGRTELAWDLNNIEILCRTEHLKVEAMSKIDRELRYMEKKGILTI